MTADPVERTRASYDLVAVDYDRRSATAAPAYLAFRDQFIADLVVAALAVDADARTPGPDRQVADLGCGPGRDLLALRAAGLAAVGVDLSGGMLAVARARGVPVVRGDLRRPPLLPHSLAGIWSSAALLHVPRPDVPATLAAWHALLRPGGRLGLSTSLGDQDGWELVPYAGDDPAGGPLHRWFVHHDEAGLLDLLARAGFTVTSCRRRTSHRDWAMIRATA